MSLFSRLKLLIYLLLFIIGCEENITNEKNDCSECIEVYTSDWEQTSFYYNLVTNTEDVTNWHVSLQKIADTTVIDIYDMPSIILGSNVLISIYNSISFDDIIAIPDIVEWSSDTSLTSYGNEYEVLHYPGTCEISSHNHPPEDHKIQVSNYNYLIKETSTNNIYKLHFEVYVSGIVMFKLSQLNIED